MAHVKPFRALRFTEKAGETATVICPPYDIISEEQRQAYLTRNPYNIIRLELPRDGQDPYRAAGDTLKTWLDEGILRQDDLAAYYIYEITFTVPGTADERRTIIGMVARVTLEEFIGGVIMPHEETLSKAKADRLDLMKATNCNFSSIYCLYHDPSEDGALDLNRLAAESDLLADATDGEGLRHRLWAVTDPTTVAAISERFEPICLTIADGHHRYETGLNYRRWRRLNGGTYRAADSIMMMLVEMNQPGLIVLPTHRLVRNLPDFSAEHLLALSEPYFHLKSFASQAELTVALDKAYAAGEKAFGFYAPATGITLMTLRDKTVMKKLLPHMSGASQQLDVTVLHTLVLERLLGIDRENMANQTCLTYTRDAAEAFARVDDGSFQCAFLLNPTRVEEIRDVAAAREKMPQKSTYFYPKLITGLTMNQLDD